MFFEPPSHPSRRRLARHARLSPAVLLLLATLLGCGHAAKKVIAPGPSEVPDFSLADVNPNSPTTGQAVSPRQQAGKISAWYFGHAT